MRFTFILAILLSILISIFALSNNELVTINYLFGKGEIVKAILIFLLIAAGAIITLLFSIPSWWRHRNEKSTLKKEINKLTQELNTARQKLLGAQQSSSTSTTTSDDSFITDVDTEL